MNGLPKKSFAVKGMPVPSRPLTGYSLKPFSRSFLVALLLWGLGGALSIYNEQGEEKKREEMTGTTKALVTDLQQNNHGIVNYVFVVDHQQHAGSQLGNSRFAVGSSYEVHYNPSEPSSSFLGPIPAEESAAWWRHWYIFIGVFACCSILMFILETAGIVSRE